MTKRSPLHRDAAAPLPTMMQSFATPVQPVSRRLSELKTLSGSPRELWIVFAMKFLDSLANFSMHIILVLYLTQEFGYSDVKAGAIYGGYGALITTYGIATGLIIDRIGVVKSMYVGSIVSLVGRLIMLLVTASAVGQALLLTTLLCILPIGNSFIFPTMMIAIRRYCQKKNRNFVYGLFYTIMIIAILISGPLVDLFRLLLSGDDNILPDGSVAPAKLTYFAWTPYRGILALGVASTAVECVLLIFLGVSLGALSPIFVVIFPNFIWAFCIFMILFGLTESIWSPRFYSLSVLWAKEGHEGMFAAFAFAPTFLAQLPVGALSGFLLSTYCPNENYCEGTQLWGIVFAMALLSPLMMVLLWRWLNEEEEEETEDTAVNENDADRIANANNEYSLDEPLLTTP